MPWSYNEKDRRKMDMKLWNGSLAKKTSSRGPPTRSADVFVARMDQLNSQLVTSNGPGQTSPPHFNTNIVDDASER
ncbi:unnamed protein product [Strongylus vulgaris]|uniref:Uncharacterized protein n=1 Tax=Strongylus vulgaris TaxID=40348 RepID=A0A3P7JL03_STRVU|nr:unnamed protein product [Strongylus vulgaris]